jgi:cytidylate kinase
MKIVTISRLVGSYGDVVAAVVARRMGLELISLAKVHELAQGCDPEYQDVCTMFETEHGPTFFEKIFFDTPTHTSLFKALTFEEASRGNVVLVGRGAQIILRDVPGVFRARLVAPKALRVERIMERYSFTRDEAEEYVRRSDHEREGLIHSIFHVDPNDWSLYDVIVNTSRYSSGAVADMIVQAVEKIEPVSDPEKVQRELRGMGLAKKIETLLRKKLTSAVARHVEVEAEADGTIKLSGRIRDKKDKDKLIKLLREYPGVQTIQDELKVTDLSFGF